MCNQFMYHGCNNVQACQNIGQEGTLVCMSGCRGTSTSMRLRKAGAGSMSSAPDHTFLSSKVCSMLCSRPMAALGT